MSGKKGMHRSTPKTSLRKDVWRSMRIMRAFTMPDLMRTVPLASEHNISRFLLLLNRHGIIAKNNGYISGRSGQYQQFRLVKDTGPTYPTVCPTCGQPLSKQCKKPETDAQKEKQTETDTETQEGPP
jgi:hypothetical protein